MILALRTDKPEAELYLINGLKVVDETRWEAHRELSNTLLIKIEALLLKNELKISDLKGIVVYQGPGSFTGLRIGITAANTLAYSLNIPIAAAPDEDWLNKALAALDSGKKLSSVIVPEYGAAPHITAPRK